MRSHRLVLSHASFLSTEANQKFSKMMPAKLSCTWKHQLPETNQTILHRCIRPSRRKHYEGQVLLDLIHLSRICMFQWWLSTSQIYILKDTSLGYRCDCGQKQHDDWWGPKDCCTIHLYRKFVHWACTRANGSGQLRRKCSVCNLSYQVLSIQSTVRL